MISLCRSSRFSIVITQFVRRFRADLSIRVLLRFSFACLVREKPLKLLKVRGGCIGDGAEFYSAFSPINPLISLPGPYLRGGVPSLCGPDKYVNKMSGARIDEHRNGALIDNVKAPALQCESVVREISCREYKFESALDPSVHTLFIFLTFAMHLPSFHRHNLLTHS